MTQLPQGIPPDSVRAVLRDVFASPAYEWSARRYPWQYVIAAWRAAIAALERLQHAHPIGFLALMFALTLIGLLLLTHIAFVLFRALRPTPRPEESPAGPLPPTRDAPWHLAEARRLADLGEFKGALAHRFLALVLQLEQRRAVLVRPSKTPAEYASEARLVPAQRGVFRDLVTTLYGAVFGARSCDAATFAEFDRAATDLALHDAAI
ncbi:MAG: DUF4129 domain-containing protein [Gemmatimonadales bacterium]